MGLPGQTTPGHQPARGSTTLWDSPYSHNDSHQGHWAKHSGQLGCSASPMSLVAGGHRTQQACGSHSPTTSPTPKLQPVWALHTWVLPRKPLHLSQCPRHLHTALGPPRNTAWNTGVHQVTGRQPQGEAGVLPLPGTDPLPPSWNLVSHFRCHHGHTHKCFALCFLK